MSGQRERFRERAREIYGGNGLTVPEHANVHPMADGGAFVEAIVWVPDGPAGGERDGEAEGEGTVEPAAP